MKGKLTLLVPLVHCCGCWIGSEYCYLMTTPYNKDWLVIVTFMCFHVFEQDHHKKMRFVLTTDTQLYAHACMRVHTYTHTH